MGLSWTHILVVALLAVLLFGRGKFSGLMGELAEGVRNFKKGIAGDDAARPEPRRVEHEPGRGSVRTPRATAGTPGRT